MPPRTPSCKMHDTLSSQFAPSLYTFLLLPLENNRQAHERQHHSLEPRIFGQQNSNVTHKGNVTDHTSYDICLAVQEVLASSVEFGIVCCVVVAFCEELKGRCFRSVFHNYISQMLYPSSKRRSKNSPTTTTKPSNHPMHNRNILAPNIIHHHFSHFCI